MYQALARKWRPKTFANLCGQEQVVRVLTHALTKQQLHHAYLFTGTRGVGKTSIARILAKSLNCEKGISAEPCGVCRACLAIDSGNFVDVMEIDAASRTRVEDTRDILDNVQYAPSEGRFKIYLIDEVHMLSTHSFNALLKTLEEPPEHVKFILATTDPDKIPMTILSRCLRLNLNMIALPVLIEQLEKILNEENIIFDKMALRYVAQAAKGSMRDALSLLEQAIANGEGTVKQSAVEVMLGLCYQQHLPPLMRALFDLDLKTALACVDSMANLAADFEAVLAEVLSILHAIAIAQAVPDATQALGLFTEISPEYFDLKDKATPEVVQLLYQIALQGQKDLPYAPTMRSGFEMVLLRMVAFYPLPPEQIEKSATVSVKVPQKIAQPQPSVQTQKKTSEPVEAKAPLAIKKAPDAVVLPVADSAECSDALPKGEKPNWETLVSKLTLSGLTRSLVRHTVLSAWEGDVIRLTLENSQKACLNNQRQLQIQEALSKVLGRPIKLFINLGDVKQQTPDHQEKVEAKEKASEMVQMVQNDPIVQNLLDTFQGKIEHIAPSDEPIKTS